VRESVDRSVLGLLAEEMISVTASDELDAVIEQCHTGLGELVKGDPEPFKRIWSNRDDVSLGNPFGPFVRGWTQAAQTMERASSNYRDGEIVGFERVSTFGTPDLVCLVEAERYKAKVGGREDLAPIELRVTSVFRREDGTWKIVHRHADPITTPQPVESVIKK
jgi:ketosteroid isomerase-like protein